MSKEEKQIIRIKSIPADYTYSEAKVLLSRFGYAEYNKGKTSGSRVKFYREADGRSALLHKPHPGDVMKRVWVREIVDFLTDAGDI